MFSATRLMFFAKLIYKGKLISYGVGYFVDDYVVEKQRNDQSFGHQVDLTGAGIRELRLLPIMIKAEAIARRMPRLSESFKTLSAWDAKGGCLRIQVQ